MMTPVVLLLALIGAAVVQVLAPAHAALGQVKAPALLAVVVYYALNRRFAVTMTAALLAGVLQDALSLVPLGYSSLLFMGAGAAMSRYREQMESESVVTAAFFGAATAAVVAVLMSLLLAHAGRFVWRPGPVVLRVAGSAVLGLVVTPAVFLVVGGLDRRVGNVEQKEDVAEFGRTDEF